MKYIWIVAFLASFILLGCQSEKEEVAKPQPKTVISTKSDTDAATAVEAGRATEAAKTAAAAARTVVSAATTGEAASVGDAVNGKNLAKRCKGCHTFDSGGRQLMGPNLFGIFGKTAGKVTGFSKYGSDLKNADFVWNEAGLAAWVCSSKAAIKALTGNAAAKTKMANQRKCGTKGQDIAAYLKSLK